ncbi:hypothetical protein [Amycolatopsis samaneae]|uniref:Uncharacterized protein n=1 Tax=Amycolatopsis samaneae TaxID=664691 RepID=A0ABW5G6S5_9PSEU
MPTPADGDQDPRRRAPGAGRQGPPTDTRPARFGRARIGRHVLFSRPERRQYQLKMWLIALVVAGALAGVLGAIFGNTLVVFAICVVAGLVIGGFGHTEADLLFRITDQGINLGVPRGSFGWADITRLTLVTLPFEGTCPVGPSGNVGIPCPHCGRTGFRPTAGLEVRGTAGGVIAQLNLAYAAAPEVVYCFSCRTRGRNANQDAPRQVGPPVGLAFLVEGWDRFSALVTEVAPHVELGRRGPGT